MSAQLSEGDKLVEIAFVGDEHQAAMIQALLEDNGIPSMQQQVTPSGPQLGYGLMNPGGGSRRVMVHAHRSGEARTILAEIEADYEDLSDPVNAEHLADAEGRGPRGYGLIGAYVRIYAVSLAAMTVMFGAYLLYRAL